MKTQLLQRGGRLAFLAALAVLFLTNLATAQVAILSTVPANGASGVSTTTTVVFTFNTAMNTTMTMPTFVEGNTGLIATSLAWSSGNTVLTCTPLSTFPANATISWFVNGFSAGGQQLGGIPAGTFTTGNSGGSTGNGTNAITSFSLTKLHSYQQTSASAPTLYTNFPFNFGATTALASNRTATAVSLTLPSSAVSNLAPVFQHPEEFSLIAFNSNLVTFDATFAAGNYTFFVQSAQSNQTVVANFPSSLTQPPAPHVANYAAAQVVNPAQPFTLTWDAYAGGTAADGIYVEIGNAISSSNLGSPGALTGTATSFIIPANTLQPNTTYDSFIGFSHQVATTNGSSYVTAVSRITYTGFNLITTGSTSSPLVLTNAVLAPGNFSFDVDCAAGQSVVVEYRANLTTGTWQTLLTTNSPGPRFHAVAPPATNPQMFFRARSGP